MSRARVFGVIGALGALGVALAWSFRGAEPGPCTVPEDAGQASILAPAPGAILTGPWALVAVAGTADDQVLLCLDGRPWPFEGVHGPQKALGGRAWIDALSLAELSAGDHEITALVRDPQGQLHADRLPVFHRPAPHRVRIRVTRDGQPVDARVVVADGEEPRLLGQPLGPQNALDRDGRVHAVFTRGGRAVVDLEPGPVRLVGVRSLFDELAIAELDIQGDTEVELEIEPAVDVSAWWLADMHVHTARSQDSVLPDALRTDSLLASGLDVAVLSDHNVRGDLPGAPGEIHLIPGIEADIWQQDSQKSREADLAHFNVWPIAPGPIPRYRRAKLGDAIHRLRADDADRVVQLNHPRGIHFVRGERPSGGAWALFTTAGFDRTQPPGVGPNGWMGDRGVDEHPHFSFEAMEVVNRFSVDLWQQVRLDWFALLDHGHWITATGNSDSHAAERELAGMVVNLVERDGPFDVARFNETVRRGAVVVTSGPLVQLRLDESRPGSTHTGPAATARVRVQAPSWVPVPEARLVVGGEIVQRRTIQRDGRLDWSMEIPLDFEEDTWIVAEAGWPLDSTQTQPIVGGDYGVVAPRFAPIAFTNAIRVDADGDGHWQP